MCYMITWHFMYRYDIPQQSQSKHEGLLLVGYPQMLNVFAAWELIMQWGEGPDLKWKVSLCTSQFKQDLKFKEART